MRILRSPVDQEPQGPEIVCMADPYSGHVGISECGTRTTKVYSVDRAKFRKEGVYRRELITLDEPSIETHDGASGDTAKLIRRIREDEHMMPLMLRRMAYPNESLMDSAKALRLSFKQVRRRCEFLQSYNPIRRMFSGDVTRSVGQKERRRKESRAVPVSGSSRGRSMPPPTRQGTSTMPRDAGSQPTPNNPAQEKPRNPGNKGD